MDNIILWIAKISRVFVWTASPIRDLIIFRWILPFSGWKMAKIYTQNRTIELWLTNKTHFISTFRLVPVYVITKVIRQRVNRMKGGECWQWCWPFRNWNSKQIELVFAGFFQRKRMLQINLKGISIFTLADLGGACLVHTTPYGTLFFCFHIHFHQKAPASGVHAPPNGSTPPYGKSWIHHWFT